MASHSGACRCGRLAYTVESDLAPVFHCHCEFCRHLHGASFTTIGFLAESSFQWDSGSAEPSVFATPLGNHRHFCGACATPIYNSAPGADLACVITQSLSDPFAVEPWAHVNMESKSPWVTINDELPAYDAWPTSEELQGLAEQHGARLPAALGSPAA